MPKPPPGAELSVPMSDATLYRAIVEKMEQGSSYYEAAFFEQRRFDYPTSPVTAIRLPTLAWLDARLNLDWVGKVLLALTCLSWAMVPQISLLERLAVATLTCAAGWHVLIGLTLIHEVWAGLLIALSASLHRKLWMAIPIALLAACIRELAFPFLLLAGTLAAMERRWKEAAAWFGAILAYLAVYAVHYYQWSQFVEPHARSLTGWGQMIGFPNLVHRIVLQTPLRMLPETLATILAAIAPLGWLALGRSGRLVFLYLCGMAILIAVLSRFNNFYWPLMVLPLWLSGLTFWSRLVFQASPSPTRRIRWSVQ